LKEEYHVGARETSAPPRCEHPRRSLKLTELWECLPEESRQIAIQSLVRMIQQASPGPEEVTHD
ncbi:MAG: hypothetical protein ACE5FA_10645, partial [Dehalococcoidia bacterium]